MRTTNMPIREMQRYAALRELGDTTSLERLKILEDHQAGIAAQILELQRAHALLAHKITNYRKIEQRIRIGGPVLPDSEIGEPEYDWTLAPTG